MSMEILGSMPLIIISTLTIVGIAADALIKNLRFSLIYSVLTLIAMIVCSAYVFFLPNITSAECAFTKNMITFGGFSSFFDILFCIAGIMTLIAAKPYLFREHYEHSEFYTLILLSISGMSIIAHSNNFLPLFIGIEIMSISFYVLAGFFRNKISSVEAAIKYFLLGAFATGFLLYGIALIYGATGTIDLSQIRDLVIKGTYGTQYFKIGLALLLIGLSFKAAAFPFHQWAPDVYQGSPTIVTGFMSAAGKAAALAAFIIVSKTFLPVLSESAYTLTNNEAVKIIIASISVCTMLYANFAALVQKNIKRMLAYSSISHAGYLLIGVVVNTYDGWSGILFYLTAYTFMQIGAFIMVSIIEKESEGNLNLQDYSGLSKSHPGLSALMAVFMFALAGLPPFAGFMGKYYLFASAVKANMTWLAVVGVVSSIISMYYYIGLIVYMYFKEPKEGAAWNAKPGIASISLLIAFIGILLFGLFPSLLINPISFIFR